MLFYFFLILSLLNGFQASNELINCSSEFSECSNNSSSNNSLTRLQCLKNLYFEELAKSNEFSNQTETKDEVGFISYAFNSTSNNVSYQREYRNNNTELASNLKIATNLTELEQKYELLTEEVNLFKALLESASKSLKATKKQLKLHNKSGKKEKCEHKKKSKKQEDEEEEDSSEEEEKKKNKKKDSKKHERKEKKDKSKKGKKEEVEEEEE